MLTMLLGGLWHGAGWNFVAWGGLHGAALICHRSWSARSRTEAPGPAKGHFVGTILTFGFVCVAWMFFRAADLGAAVTMMLRILAFDGVGDALPVPSLGLLVVAALGHCIAARHGERLRTLLPDPSYALILGALAGLALALVPLGNRPFIYFQF